MIRARPAGLHFVVISSPSLRLKASEGILIRFQAERARGTWPGGVSTEAEKPVPEAAPARVLAAQGFIFHATGRSGMDLLQPERSNPCHSPSWHGF